jgi:hypothetical protein
MNSAQFYRGKIDGIQKTFESPNLSKILPPDKLQELASYSEIGEYPRFFKDEKVLSKTVISPAKNIDGRRGGIVNHTVLYQWGQSFEKDSVRYIFPLETFISEILSGKRRFKMPPVPMLPVTDSDFGLIDLPSPIEWEVQF